jgi:uncharacterized membrane protein (UPF0182 family)
MDHLGNFHPPELDPAQVRRALRVGRFLLILIFLAVVGAAAVVPYTNFLWFKHDARQPEVFSTAYQARSLLFSSSFIFAWLLLWGSLHRALGVTLVFLKAPENVGEKLLSSALTFVQVKGSGLVRWAAPVFALFVALGFANEWNTLLLARHAQSFGKTDPTFGLDLGFFVFSLPWFRAMANGAFSLLFLTTLVTTGVYLGLQALASLAKIELGRPAIRFHLHGLLAATLLAFAVQTWLKRYEAGLVDSGQFTGAGYAGMQALGAQTIFAVLAAVVGIAILINGKFGPGFLAARLGIPALAVFYLGGLVIWPGFVQRVFVDPNRLDKEAPFAEKAIGMTRYAYQLDKIDIRDIASTEAPGAADVAAASTTIDNMRLWDPEVLRAALEGLQGIRPYYKFRDVDVDRYPVDGKPTLVMLSPRQIDLEGLAESAQNWTNQRLRYTHGYGVVATRVDRAQSDGSPTYLASDIPQEADPALKIDEPRIYYGDAHDEFGQPIDEYAVVATGEPEVDYSTPNESVSHTWKGDRGIPIGGIVPRLAFAAVLGDGNLLVSPKVKAESRLLIHRNIKDRAQRIYPFLRFDQDPYIVILEGRVVWVMDAYTTTEMIPYAEHIGRGGINYLRNSVKVVVDAYTGETTAYAVEADEPILQAYRAIYPGLVKDVSEVPAGLAAHWRYPEDLLSIQSVILNAYHVKDPTTFLSNGDGWSIAKERGLSGDGQTIRPYYVELRLPDEPTGGFVQILPFTPANKPNMIGWLAAHGDPERYGKVTLYRLAQNPPIAGPEQMEAKFNATPEISNINRQYNNDQSQLVPGNLLVVPVGKSFLYAESLFLQAKTRGVQAIPRLTKVILAHNNKTVVADTYREGLAMLFGTSGEEPTTPTKPGTAPSPTGLAGAREALEMLDKADAALRKGDFATYGRLEKEARSRLRGLTK